MKVLITTFTYYPNKDGVAVASTVLAEGLAANGWDVTVATAEEDNGDTTNDCLVHVKRFNFKHGAFNFDIHSEAAIAYRRFVSESDFDIIVFQCWEVWSTVCLLPILPKLNARKIMVSHGFRLHVYHWHPKLAFGIPTWLRNLRSMMHIFPKIISSFDAFVILSTKRDFRNYFDHLLLHWLCPKKLHIIPNALELESFMGGNPSFRDDLGIRDGIMVLSVANYCDRKNQALGLKTFRKANVPDSHLVFIGSDFNEYARQLMALDATLKINYPEGNVIFLDNITREATFMAYQASDMVILTARSETQPIVIIEAMASGKPWISTDTGCVSEMAGGIVAKSAAQLERAIHEMLSNASLRSKLGNEGREAANIHHSKSAYIEHYESLLNELHHKEISSLLS